MRVAAEHRLVYKHKHRKNFRSLAAFSWQRLREANWRSLLAHVHNRHAKLWVNGDRADNAPTALENDVHITLKDLSHNLRVYRSHRLRSECSSCQPALNLFGSTKCVQTNHAVSTVVAWFTRLMRQGQPQLSNGADDLGTTPAVPGSGATPAESNTDAPAPAPEQRISILGPEPREIDFPKFDLAKLESMSELDRRRDADSMDLPTLGTFIRQGLHGLKRLVEAYRPYVENFMERTAHQGEQRMLTNKKGEPATREQVVREQPVSYTHLDVYKRQPLVQ